MQMYQENTLVVLLHFSPEDAENCSLRGKYNVFLHKVFSGVKSLAGGCGQIGFAEKR